MDEYRVNGSAAYAPQPVQRPCCLPEEPKKMPEPEKKVGVAPFTILGTAVALILLFGVIFSYMRLFEAESEKAALEQRTQELLLEQELLRAQYEREVDMEAVAQHAAALGMHLPRPEQIVEIFVALQEPASAEQEEDLGLFEALQALFIDIKAYFS